MKLALYALGCVIATSLVAAEPRHTRVRMQPDGEHRTHLDHLDAFFSSEENGEISSGNEDKDTSADKLLGDLVVACAGNVTNLTACHQCTTFCNDGHQELSNPAECDTSKSICNNGLIRIREQTKQHLMYLVVKCQQNQSLTACRNCTEFCQNRAKELLDPEEYVLANWTCSHELASIQNSSNNSNTDEVDENSEISSENEDKDTSEADYPDSEEEPPQVTEIVKLSGNCQDEEDETTCCDCVKKCNTLDVSQDHKNTASGPCAVCVSGVQCPECQDAEYFDYADYDTDTWQNVSAHVTNAFVYCNGKN